MATKKQRSFKLAESGRRIYSDWPSNSKKTFVYMDLELKARLDAVAAFYAEPGKRPNRSDAANKALEKGLDFFERRIDREAQKRAAKGK